MPNLNDNLQQAKSSSTYAVIDRIAQKRAAGEEIFSLCAGEPDFDTPSHICEAGINAIKQGHTRYTQVAGLKALREAVARKFNVENEIDTFWEKTIICTGGKQVIFNALAATINSGDEVLIPAPYWTSYPEMVQICGGTPSIITCDQSCDFKPTPEALEASISSKTKWLILNSPSNPTGAVYSHHELSEIAEVLRSHPNVLVLSDDIYEHLTFDGNRFYTMAQVAPDLGERTLTMNGVSKAYAMTGWRLGFGTGPGWLINAMIKLQGQQTSGACSIAQHAAIAALDSAKQFITDSVSVYQHRRDLMVAMLDDIPGLACEKPEGAFYVFMNCEGLLGKTTASGKKLENDNDVASALLDEANVAVMHGSAFGLSPYLRASFACDEDLIKTACGNIKRFCESLTT